MFSKAKSKQADDSRSHSGALSDASMQKASAPQGSSKKGGALRPSGVPSLISSDVVMNGNVNSSGEIQLDGALEGDIRAGSLIVGEKAIVKGEVICETVTVRGRVEGGIRAKSVSLAATAHILGDILHSSLSVETGAHFEGNCRHSDDPLSDAAGKDYRRARPSAPAPRSKASAQDNDGDIRSADKDGASFLNQNRSPLR